MMTVSYSTDGSFDKPMIRLANRFLQRAGFNVKDRIVVEYRDEGVVIIRKSQIHEHLEMGSAHVSVHANA